MKILKGATTGMPAHFAFYVKICNKTPNDVHISKKIQTFSIIACFKKLMIIRKLLKFASKPEQPRLSTTCLIKKKPHLRSHLHNF